jgi:hypothetical protein
VRKIWHIPGGRVILKLLVFHARTGEVQGCRDEQLRLLRVSFLKRILTKQLVLKSSV